MNPKITIPLKTVIAPEFQKAFKALGDDSISITDRFRIAQTFPILVAAIGAYDEARNALLQRLGERESVILKRKQEAFTKAAVVSPDAAFVAKRIAEIEAGAEDRMAIDNANNEASAAFLSEHELLLAEQITTAMTRKVVLHSDSRLTAAQLSVLLDVVDVDPEN